MQTVIETKPYLAAAAAAGMSEAERERAVLLLAENPEARDLKATMTKKAFDKIAAGLADAIAIAKGEADPGTYRVHAPAEIDVLKIRRKMGLTREIFAMRFGLQLGTVRDWEQRKRRPEGAARVLLAVIESEPEAVTRALAAAARRRSRRAA
jgi:putative transcriptional regulator